MPRSARAIFVYLSFCLLTFTSCVDSDPLVYEAKNSLVIDYSGETVEVRLSVFANVKSDLDLAAEIRLVNEEADLQWTCRELTVFEDSEKNNWVGWAAFVAPEGEAIAKGKYVLTYEDTCEREGEIVFVVDYPDGLLEKIRGEKDELREVREGTQEATVVAQNTDAASATDEGRELEVRRKKSSVFKKKTIEEAQAILGNGTQKKIALYSLEHQLLYFGEQKDDTLSQHKDAAFAKPCLCTQDDAVICVFAEESVVR